MRPLTLYDLARLLGVAAAWGIAYIFMRIATPQLGPSLVAEFRALFAAVLLIAAAIAVGQRLDWRNNWRDYFFVGLLNNALPFACLSFGSKYLPAGYMAIINGTVSLFAALFSALILHEALSAGKWIGFVLGIVGIALIVQLGPLQSDLMGVVALLVTVAGCAFWGLGGVLIKQRADRLPLVAFAAGTTLAASVYLSPSLLTAPQANWTGPAMLAAMALGLICTGLAYLGFFSLVRDIGPSKTLSLTFLVPVFGVFWGWLLLDEPITAGMALGAAVVLFALAMVFGIVKLPTAR